MAEITLEDVYTLLTEVHKLAAENNAILVEVKTLAEQVPAVVESLSSNPMFKPFAKMLGL